MITIFTTLHRVAWTSPNRVFVDDQHLPLEVSLGKLSFYHLYFTIMYELASRMQSFRMLYDNYLKNIDLP